MKPTDPPGPPKGGSGNVGNLVNSLPKTDTPLRGGGGERIGTILIAGGGTGGHVFPAIAIADAIRAKVPDATITFVGAKGKIEMEKVPKAGYEIEGLWISGFHRKLTLRNLLFPVKLLTSIVKAFGILRHRRPQVVVGVGGYAAGPILEVATRLGIPTLIQEQNSWPGITNRLLAKKVDRICVAYPETERFFPKAKMVATGNPVRKPILDADATRADGIAHFGLDPHKQTIFLFGGSLGAASLNRAVAAQAALLRERQDVQLLWQTGKLYIEQYARGETAQLPNVHAMPFVDRMDLAYAAADVIIGRAGAGTISELCIVGKPAILVPSPNVAEDHQTANARSLADRRAAVLLKDSDANARMLPEAMELLADEARRAELGSNIHQLAVTDAAERIAAEVLVLAQNGRS